MPSKTWRRFAFVVTWIAFYFLFISLILSGFYGFFITIEPKFPNIFIDLYNLLSPSFFLFLVLPAAIFLGLVTDYYWHSHRWNKKTKSFGIVVLVIVILVGLSFMMYLFWEGSQVGGPTFEKLYLVGDLYHINQTLITLNITNTGTFDSNITGILINGMPLSSVNGGTSDPRTPLFLKQGASVYVRLHFTSPLTSGSTYNVTFLTSTYYYSIEVLIP